MLYHTTPSRTTSFLSNLGLGKRIATIATISLPKATGSRCVIMSDAQVGTAMLAVAAAVFSYYTAWVFLVPFLDESHPLQYLFLPREWAVRIPTLLLIGGVALVGSFISLIMIKTEQKKKAKLAAQKAQ